MMETSQFHAVEELTGERFMDFELNADKYAMDEYFAGIPFSPTTPPQQAENAIESSLSEENPLVNRENQAENDDLALYNLLEMFDSEGILDSIGSPSIGQGTAGSLDSPYDPLWGTGLVPKPKDKRICVPSEKASVRNPESKLVLPASREIPPILKDLGTCCLAFTDHLAVPPIITWNHAERGNQPLLWKGTPVDKLPPTVNRSSDHASPTESVSDIQEPKEQTSPPQESMSKGLPVNHVGEVSDIQMDTEVPITSLKKFSVASPATQQVQPLNTNQHLDRVRIEDTCITKAPKVTRSDAEEAEVFTLDDDEDQLNNQASLSRKKVKRSKNTIVVKDEVKKSITIMMGYREDMYENYSFAIKIYKSKKSKLADKQIQPVSQTMRKSIPHHGSPRAPATRNSKVGTLPGTKGAPVLHNLGIVPQSRRIAKRPVPLLLVSPLISRLRCKGRPAFGPGI